MVTLIKRGFTSRGGSTALAALVGALEACGDRRKNLLRVLTYHRVDRPGATPRLYDGLISATPDEFALQMEHLARRCNCVSLDEVLAAFLQGRSLPPRSVLITFDDAYKDFAEHAWPVLRRRGLPVVLFTPTAFVNRPERRFWWDRLAAVVAARQEQAFMDTPLGRMAVGTPAYRARAMQRLTRAVKQMTHADGQTLVDSLCQGEETEQADSPLLDWDQLRELARAGVAVAAHTRTHPLLDRIPLAEAREEVVGSREDLRREIGAAPPVFAYPAGAHDDYVVRMLAAEGFALAFTTRRGVNRVSHADPLRLRRINVGRRTTLPMLRAQLLPCARFCFS